MSFSVVLLSFFKKKFERDEGHFKVTQYSIANVLSIFHIVQYGTDFYTCH